MGKDKLKRFEENATFEMLFQPSPGVMLNNDFEMKGKWHSDFFKNENPIVLEIGCGKGEYTTGMAEKFPDKNFIGIDFKGARLWRGCRTSIEKGLKNVAFIRNKIEFINSFFTENEVSEIWVTFPDPQRKKQKKRLTSARFLNNYTKILKENGITHLKTDSVLMHEFTKEIIKINNLETLFATNDLYNSDYESDILDIKTHYENLFLAEGKKITYIKFKLNKNTEIINPEERDFEENI